jgi:DNA mismatch repair ATPase MutL
MERFSNSEEAVIREAEIEIQNFDLKDGEKIIAYFSKLPSISGFPYKIILVENFDGIVYSRFRQWDTEYDFTRWDNGIYNLDRLRIIVDEKILSQTESALLKEYLSQLEKIQLPEHINKENAIILDGSLWKFGFILKNKNIDYSWKAATEDINLFVPIIELMREKYLDKI